MYASIVCHMLQQMQRGWRQKRQCNKGECDGDDNGEEWDGGNKGEGDKEGGQGQGWWGRWWQWQHYHHNPSSTRWWQCFHTSMVMTMTMTMLCAWPMPWQHNDNNNDSMLAWRRVHPQWWMMTNNDNDTTSRLVNVRIFTHWPACTLCWWHAPAEAHQQWWRWQWHSQRACCVDNVHTAAHWGTTTTTMLMYGKCHHGMSSSTMCSTMTIRSTVDISIYLCSLACI